MLSPTSLTVEPFSENSMSVYTPLWSNNDCDLAEEKNRSGDSLDTVDESFGRGSGLPLSLVCVIITLVVMNVLTWIVASVRANTIYHAINQNMDVVDTHLLPRPDTGNGLGHL